MEFLAYLWLTIKRGSSMWWDFVWEQFLLAAILTFAAFVLGAMWRYEQSPWETFRQWREEPMNNLNALFSGSVGVLALIGLSFLIFLLFVAPFKMHSEQAHLLADIQGAIKENLPNFDLRPEGVFVCTMVREAESGESIISEVAALNIRVTNRGAPSALVNWKMAALLPDGRTVDGSILRMHENAAKEFDSRDELKNLDIGKRLQREATIIKKTQSLVPANLPIYGFFPAVFEGIEPGSLRVPGTVLQVTCEDPSGGKLSCSYDITGKGVTPPAHSSIIFEGEF